MSASCRCCQGDQVRVDASGRVRMDPDHRLACVSRVPIFRGLPEEDRRRIAARATTRLVPKGEVVQQQGGMPALQIVHSGQVKQCLLAEDGTQRLLRILGPGEFMGEHSVLTGRPAPREATAMTVSQVCTLSRLDVQQWLEETPQLALSLLDAVTARLEDTEARLSELVGTTVGHRLGEYLAGAADGVEGVPFDLPISKRDLAQLLGTTPETISRRLRAMSEQGLLRVGPGRRMVVMDIAGMLRA